MSDVAKGSLRWGDLAIRVASAAVLAPLGLAAIWFGGTVWAVVLAVISIGLGLEWAGLCGIGARSVRGVLVPASLLAVGLAAAFVSPPVGLVVLMAAALVTSAASSRFSAGGGVLYIGAAYLSLLMLRHAPRGFADVLLVVLVVWASDIGAYMFGRMLGGPRLAPRLSPSKTWSGAVGGLACSICVGMAVASGFWHAADAAVHSRLAVGAAVPGVAGGGSAGERCEAAFRQEGFRAAHSGAWRVA